MGACSSLLNAQVELVALKQLKEQSAVNNEKIAAKNEKHAAEMAELRRELGQAKDDRVREMQELTAKHQQELRRLQQEHIDEMRRIHMEAQEQVRADLHRERAEKKQQQTHMNISHERMGRNIQELQNQLADVNARRFCPGGNGMVIEGNKRLLAQMEAEMAQIKTNVAERDAHINFQTDAASNVGGLSQVGGMNGAAPMPYGQPYGSYAAGQPTTPMSFNAGQPVAASA